MSKGNEAGVFEFCGKDFTVLGRHQWRCKTKTFTSVTVDNISRGSDPYSTTTSPSKANNRAVENEISSLVHLNDSDYKVWFPLSQFRPRQRLISGGGGGGSCQNFDRDARPIFLGLNFGAFYFFFGFEFRVILFFGLLKFVLGRASLSKKCLCTPPGDQFRVKTKQVA